MATIKQQRQIPKEAGKGQGEGPEDWALGPVGTGLVTASSCNMLQVPMPIKSQLGPFCQHFIQQLLRQMMTESFGKTNCVINGWGGAPEGGVAGSEGRNGDDKDAQIAFPPQHHLRLTAPPKSLIRDAASN